MDDLRASGRLRSSAVAQALLEVPREVFVPGISLAEVYRASEAIVVKRRDGISLSSASAPEIVALMLEQLDVQPGQRVLEIGAGTGYNAGLLRSLVGPRGHVVSIDVDDDLVRDARLHLAQAGYADVEVIQADGALGYPDENTALFDRIILTVASNDVAPAWRQQLARPHGRLVLPLGLRGLQRSTAFTWRGPMDPCLMSDSVCACSFIPLRGALAVDVARLPLDRDGSLVLSGDSAASVAAADPVATAQRVRAASRRLETGVMCELTDVQFGLTLWLSPRLAGSGTAWAAGDQVPDLFGTRPEAHGTVIVVDPDGVALLAWSDESARRGSLVVYVSAGAEAVGHRLVRAVQRWNAAGRPGDADLTVTACPRDRSPQNDDDNVKIEQRWTTFWLGWARPAG